MQKQNKENKEHNHFSHRRTVKALPIVFAGDGGLNGREKNDHTDQ